MQILFFQQIAFSMSKALNLLFLCLFSAATFSFTWLKRLSCVFGM